MNKVVEGILFKPEELPSLKQQRNIKTENEYYAKYLKTLPILYKEVVDNLISPRRTMDGITVLDTAGMVEWGDYKSIAPFKYRFIKESRLELFKDLTEMGWYCCICNFSRMGVEWSTKLYVSTCKEDIMKFKSFWYRWVHNIGKPSMINC